MKGIIVTCLREMVIRNFGEDKWHAALESAGFKKDHRFIISWDVEDAAVMELIKTVCNVLNISLLQAADAFGEYWVCAYSSRLYKPYYDKATSARDFLLKMDDVHRITTQCIPNARPPRFEYTWLDNDTLIMKYKSPRGLIDFLAGLVKGVGKYYGENLQVLKLDNEHLKIAFSGSYRRYGDSKVSDRKENLKPGGFKLQ